jgi:hypothetical protein
MKMNLKCIFDVKKDEKLQAEYKGIYAKLKEKYGKGKYKNFPIYSSEEEPLFEGYRYESKYGENIHTGKIKEGIELTELELSMICDDGFSHFGGSSAIYLDRTFKVVIYTD